MAHKHSYTVITPLVIGEIQIQTIMRYHPIPTNMAKLKGLINIRCWRGCEATEILMLYYTNQQSLIFTHEK